MLTILPQYITDHSGKRISVVLPVQDFEAIMEELDELDDVKFYDEAQGDNDISMPIDDAFKMIEAKRNAK